VICFVFVSDRNKPKFALKRSYCKNTFRIWFQYRCEKRISALDSSLVKAVDCRVENKVPVTKSLSMDWYWIGMGRYTSVLLAVS